MHKVSTLRGVLVAVGTFLIGVSLCRTDAASSDWRGQVGSDIAAREYAITWQDGAWHAPNRAHRLRTYFTPAGIRVVPREEGTPSWEWGLTPLRYGRSGVEIAVGVGVLSGSDSLVTYDRGEILERYANDARGLEQGLTLLSRPPSVPDDAHEAHIDLLLTGTLSPSFSADGQAIDFRSPGGGAVLRYSQPRVEDWSGRALPARMEAFPEAGMQGVRITFDDGGAVYPVTVDPLASSPVWTAESDQDSSWYGLSVGTAGDVNGDGYDDVMVGAPDYDNGQANEGRAYVYLGSASGPASTASWTVEGNQTGAWLGWPLATAGDVNNDGFSDVILGARLYDNGQTDEGRAYVYLGSASGLAATPAWTAEIDAPGANFGSSVACAGDVNGDGYSDVIVGAFLVDSDLPDEGRAYVYFGSAAGLHPFPDWVVEGNQASSGFAQSVNTAGDVNGDGYSDVIVGAYYANHGEADEGRVFVYLGSASGLATTSAWSAEGNQQSGLFGNSVATAGDVNGDGYDDVIVGAFAQDAYTGLAYVYLGSSTGLSTSPDWITEGSTGFAFYGISVATAGDVNNDGYSDVIVGAMKHTNGEFEEGGVFVYFGSAAGLPLTADWIAEADQAETDFGQTAGTAGDVNGDGYDDIIVGAQEYDNDQEDEGRAFVYLGPLVPLPALGGSVTGLTTQKVTCQNQTSGGKAAGRTSDPTWDCEGLGLVVHAGDSVTTSAKGVVDGTASVGGAVTRMTPATVFCQNLTTGAKVNLRTSASSWNCESMGLVVAAGDVISTGARGTAN